MAERNVKLKGVMPVINWHSSCCGIKIRTAVVDPGTNEWGDVNFTYNGGGDARLVDSPTITQAEALKAGISGGSTAYAMDEVYPAQRPKEGCLLLRYFWGEVPDGWKIYSTNELGESLCGQYVQY